MVSVFISVASQTKSFQSISQRHISTTFLNDSVSGRLWNGVPCRAFDGRLGIFIQEREVIGDVQPFELGATEAVHQRVQKAVHVGQDHEPVEGHRRFVLEVLGPLLHPGDQQHHPGQGAGQEAEGEHHHDGRDQEHGALQLGLVPDGLLPETVHDSDGAVDQNDEGNEDLGEEHGLSQTVHHILDQRVVFSAVLVRLVAVAALEVLEHCWNRQGQEHDPDDDGDLGGLFQRFEQILATGMDHVEIPVYGRHGQEGNAGPSVEKKHEQHRFAHRVLRASPLSSDVVVCLYGQTEEQQDICQHQVEQENIIGVCFPKLELENK